MLEECPVLAYCNTSLEIEYILHTIVDILKNTVSYHIGLKDTSCHYELASMLMIVFNSKHVEYITNMFQIHFCSFSYCVSSGFYSQNKL